MPSPSQLFLEAQSSPRTLNKTQLSQRADEQHGSDCHSTETARGHESGEESEESRTTQEQARVAEADAGAAEPVLGLEHELLGLASLFLAGATPAYYWLR